jgi:hypothetical protein
MNLGDKPELRWLPVDCLSVDNRYQRTLNTRAGRKLVAEIVANFAWSAFQAILATPAGAGWLIVDGQHRVEAARQLGIAEVPAVVVTSVSVVEQALAFVTANKQRVAVNNYALHHAAVVGGDPLATEVDRVCREAGVSVPRYPIPEINLVPGQTLALSTITSLVKNDAALATLTLRCLAEAYRRTKGALRAPTIAAAALVLERRPKPDRPASAGIITSFLSQRTSADLAIEALKHRGKYGGTMKEAIAGMLRRRVEAPRR